MRGKPGTAPLAKYKLIVHGNFRAAYIRAAMRTEGSVIFDCLEAMGADHVVTLRIGTKP